MWKTLLILALLVLTFYTALLLAVELRTSQDYVRHYFTDLEGPVAFWGVNTTVSVALIGGTGLLLLFAAAMLRHVPAALEARRLFLSQAAIFGFMAFDDRFQFHEKVSYRLGIADHYVLLAVVAVEVVLLTIYARPRRLPHLLPRHSIIWFAVGVLLFGVMLFIDALVPHMMVLRLSTEDLAKTWSAAAFFASGWTAAAHQLRLHLRAT